MSAVKADACLGRGNTVKYGLVCLIATYLTLYRYPPKHCFPNVLAHTYAIPVHPLRFQAYNFPIRNQKYEHLLFYKSFKVRIPNLF